jgi:hypothetical protein
MAVRMAGTLKGAGAESQKALTAGGKSAAVMAAGLPVSGSRTLVSGSLFKVSVCCDIMI